MPNSKSISGSVKPKAVSVIEINEGGNANINVELPKNTNGDRDVIVRIEQDVRITSQAFDVCYDTGNSNAVSDLDMLWPDTDGFICSTAPQFGGNEIHRR